MSRKEALMSKVVIGIDPGKLGGIAVLDTSGSVVMVSPMPDTPMEIHALLNEYANDSVCYMENVGHGVPNQSSKATAVFARHCGHLDMALIALGIPTNTITPNKWEKSYQLGSSRGIPKTKWKNKLKAKAQQLFPQLGKQITLKTCDALLLAEYGRKSELGQ